MAWHTQRASRLKNFVLVSARKRAAGRNYSGFGFQTASSVRNAAVRNITRFAGGATHNGKRGRGTDKAKIVVALSKTENGAALFTRMQVVKDVTSKTLQQVIGKTVATGAKIECDGYRSYRNLSGVELDAKKYEPGRPSQTLCKPPMWCRIEAPHWRFL